MDKEDEDDRFAEVWEELSIQNQEFFSGFSDDVARDRS